MCTLPLPLVRKHACACTCTPSACAHSHCLCMRTAQIECGKCYFWHGQRSEGLKLWVGKGVWLGIYVISRKLYAFVQWYRHASDVELRQKHSDVQELYLSDSKEAVHPRELLAEVHVHDKKEVCMCTPVCTWPVCTWPVHSPSLRTLMHFCGVVWACRTVLPETCTVSGGTASCTQKQEWSMIMRMLPGMCARHSSRMSIWTFATATTPVQ